MLFEQPPTYKNLIRKVLVRLFPFMAAAGLLKLLIWYFEAFYGFVNPDIEAVLTILSIVIGIIMASQLPFGLSKYKEANDNLDNTRAILWNMSNIYIREGVSKADRQGFVESTRDWLEHYREYLKDRSSKGLMIKKFRDFSLYVGKLNKKYKFSQERIARFDEWLCLMSRYMSGEDSLKTIRTPHAYYEIMGVGVFLDVIAGAITYPGFSGLLVTVAIAFFFGGMYILAHDVDDPFGFCRDEIVDVDIDTPISDGQYYIDDEFRV